MSTLKTKNNDHHAVNIKQSRNFIVKTCHQCQQSFLAKYWDDELDWYIELNPTPICHHCQKSK